MPAPTAFAPIAWKAAQFGAVAAVAWYAARRRSDGPREIWREAALDGVEEGLETDFSRTPKQMRAGAAGRFRRVVRLGDKGPGVDIDLSALGRIRMTRVYRGE